MHSADAYHGAVISEVRAPAGEGRMYEMAPDQVAEAVLAAAKLGGVDRVWFTSGSELGVLQEAAVKNRALGRPTPGIASAARARRFANTLRR
jgi:hypothetical protein